MRRTCLFLVFLLVLSMSAQAVVLEAWITRPNEIAKIIQELTEEFFTPRTGISIDFINMDYDGLWQRGLLGMATGDVPDLATFGSEWPVEFGVRGGLIDLRATYGQEFEALEKLVFPGQMRSLEFMGTAFGLPLEFGFGLAYYRTDIFADMGWEFPTTWSDVEMLLPRLQARGMNMGTISQYLLPDWQTVYSFVWQAGGVEVKDNAMESGLDSREAIAGFNQLARLFTTYRLPQAVIPMGAFADGTYPIVVGGNWNYPAIETAFPQVKGKYDVALVPGSQRADGSISHAVYNGPLPFGIFKASRYPNEAWEFIKWFFSTEIQLEYGRRVVQRIPGSFFFSANTEAASRVDYFPAAHVEVMFAQSMQSVAPRFGMGSVISQRYVANAMMDVILRGTDPEQAVLQAASQMNQEMRRKQAEFDRFIRSLR